MSYGAALGQDPHDLPLSGGTMEGPINMDGNKITNLEAPVDPGDAVNYGTLSNYFDRGAIKTGTYTGEGVGNDTQYINLGGKPKFVLVVGKRAADVGGSIENIYIFAATPDAPGYNVNTIALEITSNGFSVTNNANRDSSAASPYKYLAIM